MPTAYDGDSLPSPDELKEYEKAFPGMGRELVAMAKDEQRHLQEMERRDYALSSRGQLFGFLIALAFLAAATFLIYTHHDTAGTIIGSTDLVALVAVFVVGRRMSATSSGNSIDSLIKELNMQSKSPRKLRKSKKNFPGTPVSNNGGNGGNGTKDQPPAVQSVEKQPAKASVTDSLPSAQADSHAAPVVEDKPPKSPAGTVTETVERKIIIPEPSEEDRNLWRRLSAKINLPQEEDK